ncbi:MAG: hypothetical protein DI532_20525 [Azospirillum brasilense]|nr:MAG: hypothetical protein DI532_20525 [Azospirillum brasilense]
MAAHNDRSLRVIERLAKVGLPSDVQHRLGTLAVVWNLFETRLERALWALRDEQVAGTRPWTDRNQVSTWIAELARDHGRLPGEALEVLRIASEAAFDLMEYRHAVLHGWLLPMPPSAIYVRNPSLRGEVRRRPGHAAHVDANLLDMAIDAGWTLAKVVIATEVASVGEEGVHHLVQQLPKVRSARLQLAELRNLTSYMNHEKN